MGLSRERGGRDHRSDNLLNCRHIWLICPARPEWPGIGLPAIGGAFVVWQVMPRDGDARDAFIAVTRMKNALAGYGSIVRDRYLFRLDEVRRMLAAAGFPDARAVRQVGFRQSTLARRDSEPGGSDEKLKMLNAHRRADQEASCQTTARGD